MPPLICIALVLGFPAMLVNILIEFLGLRLEVHTFIATLVGSGPRETAFSSAT